MFTKIGFSFLACIFISMSNAQAQDKQPDSWFVEKSNVEQNAFLLVTHRGGIAKGLAHNHVVFAKKAEIALTTPGVVEQGKFQAKILADDLDLDSTNVTNKWFPKLKSAEILDEMPGEVSESDRTKIRKDMLGPDQLDSAKFAEITAEVLGLTPMAQNVGKFAATHNAEVKVTIRNQSVVRVIPARVVMTGDTLNVEAFGAYKFTEFGIKPVSLFFGAIQNKDEIHVYVNFTATRKKG